MGRKLELQPPTAGITNATTQQDARFAVSTARAKTGVIFVNMLENTGGVGNVDFTFWTASDTALDPNLASPSGNWVQAGTLSFTAAAGRQTKTATLSVIGDLMRYSVVIPASNTSRFSIYVYVYDT